MTDERVSPEIPQKVIDEWGNDCLAFSQLLATNERVQELCGYFTSIKRGSDGR